MLSYLMYFIYLSAITIAKSVENGEIHEYYELEDGMDKYFENELETIYNDFNDNKTAKTDKVELKVYYECLCRGCRKFHRIQLTPTYKKIGSYIDLKTYPYGNAKKHEVNGKTEIACQYGPKECYGNKLHACAIDILKNDSQSVVYNSCMMKGQAGVNEGSTDADATKCGKSLGIDSKPIIECAKSQRGEDLLEYYGRETDKLTHKTYVPYILLNGKVYRARERNLMKRVCEALTNPPPPCKQLLHSTK